MKPYQLIFAPALAVATLAMAVPSPAVGSAAAWAMPAPTSSGVGDALPAPEFSDFLQTEAKSFSEYKGRAVLIEFFEYW